MIAVVVRRRRRVDAHRLERTSPARTRGAPRRGTPIEASTSAALNTTNNMPFLLLASKSKVGKRRRASSSSSSSSSSSQKLDDDDGPREEKRRDAFVSLSFFAPFRRRQRAGF
tara:strand:- start:3461 stop:3799 length:339 start_codon:yes stop_codon:yes gene_type:complete